MMEGLEPISHPRLVLKLGECIGEGEARATLRCAVLYGCGWIVGSYCSGLDITA